ncbi:MAG: GNAT family N-acetyltransferase [Candidatus Eisenbacteria bacterium]|nr:GNAT family N-acetyltransferase [Candidatus Eisenbacteria bacterium]
MPDWKLPITTPRLVLRDFVEEDWRSVHEYGSDPEVVRFMPWGPNTEEDTRAFVARALSARQEKPRRTFELAVTLGESGGLIGGCGIRVSRPTDLGADMGYCLRRDCWGRGYGTELSLAIVGFGFEELGLHRIIATCDPDNVASVRVLEKTGMKREATLREDSRIRGVWRDSYLYAILESEWTPSRGDA